ncbi:hypothetical protein [Pseudonocardia charpentierae]|uniref:Uncharacterized protein n=1 Tax=Pseudonocardia charpentierae TaxID=3075545 RepID=A0ABU2NJ26_9PSEU|nr:hypothetical protein [Pseudonocardia sp. DSM 45834]MDT0353976.1 hypothetical protein [Pseudonocardia sp. DSM 45834]
MESQGEQYVFAHPLTWSQEQVDEINSAQKVGINELDKIMRSLGGVDPTTQHISLVLQGNAITEVQITNIAVIKDKCTAPLAGGFYNSPPAGGATAIDIEFDLDEPIAVAKSPSEAGVDAEYFRGHVVSLKPDEQVPFFISVRSLKQYCEFRLQLTVVDQSGTSTQIIDNHGESFAVSATLYDPSGAPPYQAYETLYVAGVASEGGPIKVDPSSYTGE